MKISARLCGIIVVSLVSLLFTCCSNSGSQTPPPPVYYSIGGSVTNLVSGDSVQLQDNGGDTLTVTANGSFTFATKLQSGSSYSVSISAQPTSPAQTCGVTSGTGTASGNVTSVAVDCGHNEWTWVGGANLKGQAGIYGTLGTPAPTNAPGTREEAMSWSDSAGNFWLFGGGGFGATAGIEVALNDLWEYSGGEWEWVGGSNSGSQNGVYGTLGTPAPGNVPGSRGNGQTLMDANGNLWLFGGIGFDAADGVQGYLNDLWKYSGGEWAWMSGTNLENQMGMYGTQGTAASGNVPGGRCCASAWIDTAGNFWLLGGEGYDSAGTYGLLNDLWEYSGGRWTWVGGSDVVNQPGIYGAQGTAAASNLPGARDFSVCWADKAGNFWLFGGNGYNSAGHMAILNDLWKYSGGQWTWVSGSDVGNQAGNYGIQGTPAAGNIPGGRYGGVAWADGQGNFWLFGGDGLDSKAAIGSLNDLWKFSGGQWAWMSGSNVAGQTGIYGTEGTPAPNNVPGARWIGVAWIDSAGNLWLFGGLGSDSTGTYGDLNDLWRYEP